MKEKQDTVWFESNVLVCVSVVALKSQLADQRTLISNMWRTTSFNPSVKSSAVRWSWMEERPRTPSWEMTSDVHNCSRWKVPFMLSEQTNTIITDCHFCLINFLHLALVSPCLIQLYYRYHTCFSQMFNLGSSRGQLPWYLRAVAVCTSVHSLLP